MILYVAGPYRGDIDRNIQQAREIAIELWNAGHPTITPHLNTAHFSEECTCPEEVFLDGYLDIVRRSDGMVMTPDWENSAGARAEHALAKELGLPIWVWPDHP